jgi:hypothetical protein
MNSIKKQARLAGLLYLLASIPAPFGLIYGAFGYFRSGSLSFDRVSSHACWASCCSLQVSPVWPIP